MTQVVVNLAARRVSPAAAPTLRAVSRPRERVAPPGPLRPRRTRPRLTAVGRVPLAVWLVAYVVTLAGTYGSVGLGMVPA